jgi:hypothetical protein
MEPTNNAIIWWNITFTNGRSVIVALEAGKIRFANRTKREKEDRTFHDREQHMSHEPSLISKILSPVCPIK